MFVPRKPQRQFGGTLRDEVGECGHHVATLPSKVTKRNGRKRSIRVKVGSALETAQRFSQN